MSIIRAKPTSPGRRHVVSVTRDVHKSGPLKALTSSKKRTGGRNNKGRITTRHIGGGHKRKYRVIDFKRCKPGVPGRVEHIAYDPNRTAHIALIVYDDGDKRYIVASKNMKIGDRVKASSDADIRAGNWLPLNNIPLGSVISCVELYPGGGAKLARAAGAYVQLLAKEGDYATIRLRSGEVRKIHIRCSAMIGEVSNGEHNLRSLGKAGAKRWRGIRPTVRGVAMNPIDHPMGGGEGRTSGGRHPCSPWGQLAKGKKTRTNKRTDKFIVRRRKSKK